MNMMAPGSVVFQHGEMYGLLMMKVADTKHYNKPEEWDEFFNRHLVYIKPGDSMEAGFVFLIAAHFVAITARMYVHGPLADAPDVVVHYPDGLIETTKEPPQFDSRWYPAHVQVSDNATNLHLYVVDSAPYFEAMNS